MKNIVLLPTSDSRINKGQFNLTEPVFGLKAVPIEGDDLYVPMSQLEEYNFAVIEGGLVTHNVDCIDLTKVKNLHPHWMALGWWANGLPIERYTDNGTWEQVDSINLIKTAENYRLMDYPAAARVHCDQPELILALMLDKRVLCKDHESDTHWKIVTNTLLLCKHGRIFKVEEQDKYPMLREHLCQFLRKDYADKLIEETDKAGCIYTDNNNVGEAINWTHSPQGSKFWEDLYYYTHNTFEPHDWRKHTI